MLIGLHAKAQHGKDTVANHLHDAHNFTRMAFATPLKDMLIALGVPRANLDAPELKDVVIDWIGQSPRQLMQSLGTEWGRGLLDDEIWLRHAARRMVYMKKLGPNVVVTDVRYANEAQWVRAQGGRIWHVLSERPTTAHNDHSSEAGLPVGDDDITLFNNAGIADLQHLVDMALSRTAD